MVLPFNLGFKPLDSRYLLDLLSYPQPIMADVAGRIFAQQLSKSCLEFPALHLLNAALSSPVPYNSLCKRGIPVCIYKPSKAETIN